MTNNRTSSNPSRASEWDHAWQLVCRLASVRVEILADVAADKPAESIRPPVAIPASIAPINRAAAVDPEEFAACAGAGVQGLVPIRRLASGGAGT